MPRVVPTEIVQALRQYSEDEIEFVFDLNGVKYGNAGLDVRFREGGILNVSTRGDRRNMVHMQPDGTQLRQNGVLRLIRGIAVNQDAYRIWVFITTATASFEIYASSQTARNQVIYQRPTAQDWRVFQNLGASAEDGSLWTILSQDEHIPDANGTFCAFRDGNLYIIAEALGYRAQLSMHRGKLHVEVRINGVPQRIRGFSAEALEREGTPAMVIIRTNGYTLQIVATSYISL